MPSLCGTAAESTQSCTCACLSWAAPRLACTSKPAQYGACAGAVAPAPSPATLHSKHGTAAAHVRMPCALHEALCPLVQPGAGHVLGRAGMPWLAEHCCSPACAWAHPSPSWRASALSWSPHPAAQVQSSCLSVQSHGCKASGSLMAGPWGGGGGQTGGWQQSLLAWPLRWKNTMIAQGAEAHV